MSNQNDARQYAVDLHEDGILWAINNTIFHPRGLALSTDENGNWSILIPPDGVFQFTPDIDQQKREDFADLMQRIERAKVE